MGEVLRIHISPTNHKRRDVWAAPALTQYPAEIPMKGHRVTDEFGYAKSKIPIYAQIRS